MNLLELIEEQKRDLDYTLCNLQLAWIHKIEAADIPYENIEPYEDEVSNCRQEVFNRYTTFIIQLLEAIVEGMEKTKLKVINHPDLKGEIWRLAAQEFYVLSLHTQINNLTEVIQKVK